MRGREWGERKDVIGNVRRVGPALGDFWVKQWAGGSIEGFSAPRFSAGGCTGSSLGV
jgi:hypothetical protein